MGVDAYLGRPRARGGVPIGVGDGDTGVPAAGNLAQRGHPAAHEAATERVALALWGTQVRVHQCIAPGTNVERNPWWPDSSAKSRVAEGQPWSP